MPTIRIPPDLLVKGCQLRNAGADDSFIDLHGQRSMLTPGQSYPLNFRLEIALDVDVGPDIILEQHESGRTKDFPKFGNA